MVRPDDLGMVSHENTPPPPLARVDPFPDCFFVFSCRSGLLVLFRVLALAAGACSRLHLVDSELRQYKGRERELLRKYKARYAPDPPMGDGPGRNARGGKGQGGGGMAGVDQGYHRTSSGGSSRPSDVKQRAREEEQRRVQASLDASLDRILGRKTSRR